MLLHLVLYFMAYPNHSIAEVTCVILCGCLPIVPKMFQLFRSKSKPKGSSRPPIGSIGSSKETWSKRNNLLPTPSASKARATRGNSTDLDIYINDAYVPLTEQDSIQSSRIDMSREDANLEKNHGTRKTKFIETITHPGFGNEVETVQTIGPLTSSYQGR